MSVNIVEYFFSSFTNYFRKYKSTEFLILIFLYVWELEDNLFLLVGFPINFYLWVSYNMLGKHY